ncbi:MAG: hypothetical protein IJT23_03065 [Clostridia bacterium]|nr:hypothetical protein [Clostridia bacterium]
MKTTVLKKVTAIACASAMSALLLPTAFAAAPFSTNFNDGTVPSEVVVANATATNVDVPGCGRFADDKSYHIMAKNAAYAEPNVEFDFYKGVKTLGNQAIQSATLEFSMLYSNIGDCELLLHEDVSTNIDTLGWIANLDYLKIQSGKVYAMASDKTASVDTGIAVEENKWYRIAVERFEDGGRKVNVYFNGQKIVDGFDTGGNGAYDKSTYFKLKSPSTNGIVRSVYLDDVSVYEGRYSAAADAPTYTSSGVSNGTLSVPVGTTAAQAAAMVTPTGSGTPFVMKQQTGAAQLVTGAVSTGNVIVIPSTSGKAMSYVNIATYDVAPTFVGTPEKVTADGIDAVAFFGEITDAGTSSDWGITVSLPELGSRDIVIGKEVKEGGLPFGVILTNLKDGWREAMTAAYKN